MEGHSQIVGNFHRTFAYLCIGFPIPLAGFRDGLVEGKGGKEKEGRGRQEREGAPTFVK